MEGRRGTEQSLRFGHRAAGGNAGTLALGAWFLTIQASNDTSASATLNVVTKIYRNDAPWVAN